MGENLIFEHELVISTVITIHQFMVVASAWL